MQLKNLFITIILLILSPLHPIHLTVTNIDYNEKKGIFLIRTRFFVDDFKKIVAIKYNLHPEFTTVNPTAKLAIKKYYLDHFKIYVNGKSLNMNKLIIKEYWLEDIVLWIDLEIKYKGKVNEIGIYNTFFTDLYFDQKNLLILNFYKKQFAFKFDKKQKYHSVKL